MPPLSENDFRQGAVVLSLIEDWSSWVHRRVEHVTLADPQISERRVSLDFTVAPDPTIPPLSKDPSTYFVPVTWISKHRITKFSLRDESDCALAILTQLQTAAIATTMLAVMAADLVQPTTDLRSRLKDRQFREPYKPIPPDVLDDLWIISAAKRDYALQTWARLHRLPNNDMSSVDKDESELWRNAMAGEDEFMRLANDMARNFLILTPLVSQPGSRRVIKLSYEEQRQGSPIRQRNKSSPIPIRIGQSVTKRRDSTMRSYLWETERFFGIRTKRLEVPASSVGRAQCYHLEVDVPEGIRLTHARLVGYLPKTDTLAADETKSQPVSGVKSNEAANALQGTDRLDDTQSEIVRSSQCAHLHLADVPRSFTGTGIVGLRLREELVLRGAWLNSALTAVLLVLIAVFLKSFQEHTDATVAVLLGVPGGVSLYLARPREPGMSAAMHSGVRLLALANGMAAFTAIAVFLAAGGECTASPKTGKQVCADWSQSRPSFIALAVFSGVILVVLSMGYINSRWPPELRRIENKSKQSLSDLEAGSQHESGVSQRQSRGEQAVV